VAPTLDDEPAQSVDQGRGEHARRDAVARSFGAREQGFEFVASQEAQRALALKAETRIIGIR
jgi:hypothetical protein